MLPAIVPNRRAPVCAVVGPVAPVSTAAVGDPSPSDRIAVGALCPPPSAATTTTAAGVALPPAKRPHGSRLASPPPPQSSPYYHGSSPFSNVDFALAAGMIEALYVDRHRRDDDHRTSAVEPDNHATNNSSNGSGKPSCRYVNAFLIASAPAVRLDQFLKHLYDKFDMSPHTFAAAFELLRRVAEPAATHRHSDGAPCPAAAAADAIADNHHHLIVLQARSVHRLWFVACVVACKCFDDVFFQQSHYAASVSMTKAKLMELEIIFMILLGWDAGVEPDVVRSILADMTTRPMPRAAAGMVVIGDRRRLEDGPVITGAAHSPPSLSTLIQPPLSSGNSSMAATTSQLTSTAAHNNSSSAFSSPAARDLHPIAPTTAPRHADFAATAVAATTTSASAPPLPQHPPKPNAASPPPPTALHEPLEPPSFATSMSSSLSRLLPRPALPSIEAPTATHHGGRHQAVYSPPPHHREDRLQRPALVESRHATNADQEHVLSSAALRRRVPCATVVAASSVVNSASPSANAHQGSEGDFGIFDGAVASPPPRSESMSPFATSGSLPSPPPAEDRSSNQASHNNTAASDGRQFEAAAASSYVHDDVHNAAAPNNHLAVSEPRAEIVASHGAARRPPLSTQRESHPNDATVRPPRPPPPPPQRPAAVRHNEPHLCHHCHDDAGVDVS